MPNVSHGDTCRHLILLYLVTGIHVASLLSPELALSYWGGVVQPSSIAQNCPLLLLHGILRHLTFIAVGRLTAFFAGVVVEIFRAHPRTFANTLFGADSGEPSHTDMVKESWREVQFSVGNLQG